MKGKILYLIIGLSGAMTAIIPFINACPSGMACHTAKWAATLVGAVIVILSALVFLPFIRKIKNPAISVLLLICGIETVVFPRIFRLCGSMEMACRYLFKPALTILGSVIIILSLAVLIKQIVSNRREQKF